MPPKGSRKRVADLPPSLPQEKKKKPRKATVVVERPKTWTLLMLKDADADADPISWIIDDEKISEGERNVLVDETGRPSPMWRYGDRAQEIFACVGLKDALLSDTKARSSKWYIDHKKSGLELEDLVKIHKTPVRHVYFLCYSEQHACI